VRWRRRYLPAIAALGAAVAVLVVGVGQASEPTIEATGNGYGGYRWQPSTAEVSPGGAVRFQNASASVEHGVVWTGGPETPNCSGIPIGKGETSWKGTCTFTHPGVYMFRCFVHPTEMTGSITVTASGTTITTTASTPTTPTTTTPTPSTTGTTPAEPLSGSPLAGSPALRASQRGGAVRGSLEISRAGAGDRLEIDLFANSASLAAKGRSARVPVGRLVRGSVPAGPLAFSVKLDGRARRALKRHRKLALTVKITLTPVHGERVTLSRAVVEHA
jgi:plastocyanin